MIGFVIRKSFYDFWDNMLRMMLVNLGFLLAVALPTYLPRLVSKFTESLALEMALTGAGILACSVYLAAAGYSIRKISDYGSFGFGEFFSNFKHSWKAGIMMGFAIFFLYLVVTIIIPFYLSIESVIGLALAAMIFWVTIFGLVSFQFYFSVYSRLGGSIFKSFKKCMIVSLDNTGFSFFIFIHNLLVLILPFVVPFTMFVILFPGPAGILLYLDEAIRLRLLKYDWLEVNTGANRKKIPWEELLIEEREKLGPPRTFKNFIFPWKD